jgi:hypothetical protein
MADVPERLTDASNTAADFLLTDLDTAFTFLEVAAVSGNEETRERNHKKAHRAYQTVLRLLDTVSPEAPQRPAINQKLAILKERLEKVGYRF